LTSLSCLQVRCSKLLGTVKLSSSDVLHSLRSRRQMPCHLPLSSISLPKPVCPMPVTPKYLCAQPFALTWVAFQCHILVHTRDGCASATAPCTTSSEESDRDPLRLTCHTSTTLAMVPSSVLRNSSSPTSQTAHTTYEKLIKAITKRVSEAVPVVCTLGLQY